MSEWKKVRLGDIASAIQTGPFGSQLHQSDYSDIGVPVVMPKDIINGCIDESTIARVESHHVERLSRHKISEGDILYARRGDVGKCAYTVFAQQGWLCGTGCLRVTIDKEKAFPKFIFFQLQKRETIGWVEKHAIGATMLNLNTSILGDVPIELPPLSIQHRIATILSRYDSLIENYQKQIKLLEEAAQRLYKEWFVDLHFPGHENTKIVDGVPEGWEKKCIAELGSVITGKTPSTSKRENYGGSIPFITIPDMHTGIFPVSSQFLSDIGANSQKGKFIPADSLMVSCIGTAGLVCISSRPCQTNQQINSLVLHDKSFLYFLYYAFLMLKEHLNNIGSNGATMTNVNKSKFESISLLIPTGNLISSYNDKAKPYFKNIRQLSSQIRLLTEARDRLLPKLMSGEIAV